MAGSALRLDGLTAIVTGSSSGIGRSIALAFAREGAKHVVCVDIVSEAPNFESRVDAKDLHHVVERELNEELSATHELIRQRHGQDKATFFKCDVSLEKRPGEKDPENGQDGQKLYGVAGLMDAAMQTLGRLDV